MVGISGNASERIAVVTARARSLPALTYSIDEGTVANMTCTCPATDVCLLPYLQHSFCGLGNCT